MIPVGVLLAVIVALLRGGKLEGLGELNLKGVPLAGFALLIRIAVRPLEAQGFAYGAAVQIGAYLLFFVTIWLNLNRPGLKLFGLGSVLNFIVIAANGGTMPVSARAMEIARITVAPTGTHSLLTQDTRLWFLADVIPVWTPVAQIISVGDILIVVGVFLFIQHRMLQEEAVPALVSIEK